VKYFISARSLIFISRHLVKRVDTINKRIRESLESDKQACVQNFDNEGCSCEHGNLSSCRHASHSFPVVAY